MKKFIFICAIFLCCTLLMAEKPTAEPLGITKSDVENFCKNSDAVMEVFKEMKNTKDKELLDSQLENLGISGDNRIRKAMTIASYIRMSQFKANEKPETGKQLPPDAKSKMKKGEKPENNKQLPPDAKGKMKKGEKPENNKQLPPDAKGKMKKGEKSFEKDGKNFKGKRPHIRPIHPDDLKVLQENVPKEIKEKPFGKTNQ